jgi:putative tryptophan/tyrosine transport system substrate-binding protein
MNRREFVVLLGASGAAWPFAARAQQPTKVPRIGYLRAGYASAQSDRIEALRTGLRQLGYVEGKNITIEFRFAERTEVLRELADDLVRAGVDIIFATSSIEVEAARQATKTIPIVFATHGDPVGVGHVASLARPGANITGLSMLLTELAAKELELLKEAVPHATRIGVLWDATNPSHRPAVLAMETAGERLGAKLVMVPVKAVEDYESAFSTMSGERVGSILVVSSALFVSQRAYLAELALKYRLPGMFAGREHVQAGGLISYAPDLSDLTRRAATYIDKILRGAKPADLPIEQASKYQLVINLKTAKALGLAIPPAQLARADEVID